MGLGFDVHPYSDDPSRPLVLGGVTFPSERGLSGHSDADVVAHAVADSMLGAAGLGDIGEHFSDQDPAWEGANSLQLLERVAQMLDESGWRIVNADAVVIADSPVLAPYCSKMELQLTEAARGPVKVKAKRSEGIVAGVGQGIACWSVCLAEKLTL